MPPVFVDARTLADRLDVSYETVLTWVRRGRIPHVRDGRRRLMFNLNSVLSSLRSVGEETPRASRPEGGGV